MTYKGYRIEHLGTFPMVKIMPPGSGNVPNELLGLFTTVAEAQRQIDTSLSNLLTKRKRHGKKESAPTR